jgi:hypothetical protein
MASGSGAIELGLQASRRLRIFINSFVERDMGNNSTQGIAVLLFLLSFTFLGGALYTGGNILFLLLFLGGFVASIAVFLKCKPMENT